MTRSWFLLAAWLGLACGPTTGSCPPGSRPSYGADTSGGTDPCPDCWPAERSSRAQDNQVRNCVRDER